MEIYVIRHTTVSVKKGICYGQFDAVLSHGFMNEIMQVKNKLPNDFDKIFSSPSSRCGILAEVISSNKVEYHNNLMEMNFGIWENTPWESMEQQVLTEWMNDFVFKRTPEGESLELLYERVALFIAGLRTKKYKKVAIITHAGVIRCLWAYVLNIPLENIFKIPVDFGEIMIFKLADERKLDSVLKKVL